MADANQVPDSHGRPTRASRIQAALLGTIAGLVAGSVTFGRIISDNDGYHLAWRVKPAELLRSIEKAHLAPLAGIAFVLTAATFVRALQIRITARTSVGVRPRYLPILRAAAVSSLAQDVLPLRLGEPLKLLVMRVEADVMMTAGLAAAVVDRSLDVAGLLLVGVLVPLALDLPTVSDPTLSWALRRVVALLLLLVAITAGAVVLHERIVPRVAPRFPRLAALIELFGVAASKASERRTLLAAGAASLVIAAFYGTTCTLALIALDVGVPPSAGLFLGALIAFAGAIPSAPSALGVFHAAAYFGLTRLGASDTEALSFALLLHALTAVISILVASAILVVLPGTPLRELGWKHVFDPPPAPST